jgi:hypothetical protein
VREIKLEGAVHATVTVVSVDVTKFKVGVSGTAVAIIIFSLEYKISPVRTPFNATTR